MQASNVPAYTGTDIPADSCETVIVGGGQAGLAVGYHLTRLGQPCVILDEHPRTGDAWRQRYDSLRLYSPAKYNGLPGMPFPAPPRAFPTGQEMAGYLESYAAKMKLPVLAGTRADGLWRAGDDRGGYLVRAGSRLFRAAQVVIATGGQQVPWTPPLAGRLDPGIRQLHSSDYRNPSQLLRGPVLVVGAGHSGADIALEVAEAHRTYLSGTVRGQIPFDIEGRAARRVFLPLLWQVAQHVLTVRTPLGRRMRPEIRAHGGPLLRVRLPDLEAAGVEHIGARTAGVHGGKPVLDGGRVLEVTNVIWCTGFRPDFSWIHLEIGGPDGWPRQYRGVAESEPGLYFAGLLFQYAFSSMLIGGAGRDAAHVARHIASRQPQAGRRVPVPA